MLDINSTLHLGITVAGLLFGKNPALNNVSYLSPQNEIEMRKDIEAQIILTNLNRGDDYWDMYNNDPQWHWDLLLQDNTTVYN